MLAVPEFRCVTVLEQQCVCETYKTLGERWQHVRPVSGFDARPPYIVEHWDSFLVPVVRTVWNIIR